MCVYVHMYVSMYICHYNMIDIILYIYVCMYINTTYPSLFRYLFLYIICIYIYICICIYVCMCVYMFVLCKQKLIQLSWSNLLFFTNETIGTMRSFSFVFVHRKRKGSYRNKMIAIANVYNVHTFTYISMYKFYKFITHIMLTCLYIFIHTHYFIHTYTYIVCLLTFIHIHILKQTHTYIHIHMNKNVKRKRNGRAIYISRLFRARSFKL